MFTYAHNNPPPPFNPDYLFYAKDVSTIATANCHKQGLYDNPNQKERAAARKTEYNRLIALGKPSRNDVHTATQYLYNL